MTNEKKMLFGKPSEPGKIYLKNLYCYVCNQIPYIRDWQEDGRLRVIIEDLIMLDMDVLQNAKPERIATAVCQKCLVKIQEKMHKIVVNRFKPPEAGTSSGTGLK